MVEQKSEQNRKKSQKCKGTPTESKKELKVQRHSTKTGKKSQMDRKLDKNETKRTKYERKEIKNKARQKTKGKGSSATQLLTEAKGVFHVEAL